MTFLVAMKAMLYSLMATVFFALLMQSPRKSVPVSSAIASIGYLFYTLLAYYVNELLGYFIGTLMIALLGEWAARLFKKPANIFIFPAVIPMVPGMGLYRTMLAMVQGNLSNSLSYGVNTILIAGTMAMALASSAVLVSGSRQIKKMKKSKE